jgi:hypothetical protein
MAALARVTADPTFIMLSADTFHQAGQIRPSPHLHENFPVPANILASSKRTINREFFYAPDDNTDLTNHKVPLLTVPTGATSFYIDPRTARTSQFKMGVFDSDPNVFVVSSHDPSMASIIPFFPTTLNAWKAKGWKTQGVWNFANSNARGYRLS